MESENVIIDQCWARYRKFFAVCDSGVLKKQSWALSVFLNGFNNKQRFVSFFIKLIRLGVGFLNRTGAEIGHQLDKECKN